MGPAWSPDGSQIAFTRSRHVNADVYVVNVDGSGLRRLTNSKAAELAPVWSPDTTKIAFVRAKGDSSDIWVMDVDGTGKQRLTTSRRARELTPGWSPDGKRIAFARERGVNVDIYTMTTDGTKKRRLTATRFTSERAPDWSPDGRRIAFVRIPFDIFGTFDIWTMKSDGRSKRRITRTPFFGEVGVRWAPRGQQLLVSRSHGLRGDDIYVMNADGRRQRKLTSKRTNDSDAAWSPDGTTIAYASSVVRPRRDTAKRIWLMNADGRDKRQLDTSTADAPTVIDPEGGNNSTLLSMTVWPQGLAKGQAIRYELSCAPPRGTVPNMERACAELAVLGAAAFAPLPNNVICLDLFGGPQEAEVEGLVGGERVETVLRLRNECEISHWERLSAIVPGSEDTAAP